MTIYSSYHLAADDKISFRDCGLHKSGGFWLSLYLGQDLDDVTLHVRSFAQLQQLADAVDQAMQKITDKAESVDREPVEIAVMALNGAK